MGTRETRPIDFLGDKRQVLIQVRQARLKVVYAPDFLFFLRGAKGVELLLVETCQ